MLKGRIYSLLKGYLTEYMFGFDEKSLETNFWSGNIVLKNLNLKPDKISELLGEESPYSLKAGLISNLKIKGLLSKSLMKMKMQGFLFLYLKKHGPPNLSQFDENSQLNNLLKTHTKEYDERKREALEKKEKIQKEREERVKKRAAEAAQKKQPKKKSKPSEPPMNLLISLIGNLKFSIKRIHFRIEDDYFNHNKPVAFGLMVEEISFLNATKHWVFDSPLTMQHKSEDPENMSTTLKDLVVKNVKVYWNSMSEMFVPTSLWQQTKHNERQIFSALDPEFLKSIMVQAFYPDRDETNFYLVEPFSVYISLNFNKSYSPQNSFKYQMNLLITKIQLNLTSLIMADIYRFQAFAEMRTYQTDLKKFKPLVRPVVPALEAYRKVQGPRGLVQIDYNTEIMKKKRKNLIRDWWQLSLWYVRLKKAAQGATPFQLLEIEAKLKERDFQGAEMKVKRARVEDYVPFYGEDDSENMLDILNQEAHDMMEEFGLEDEIEKFKNAKKVRNMLDGCKMGIRLQEIKFSLFSEKYTIQRDTKKQPSFSAAIDMISILSNVKKLSDSTQPGVRQSEIDFSFMIKEIRLEDQMRRDLDIQPRTVRRKFGNGQRGADIEQPQLIRRNQSNTAVGLMTSALDTIAGPQEEGKSNGGLQGMLATPAKGLKNLLQSTTVQEVQRTKELTKAENYDFLTHDIPDTTEEKQQMFQSKNIRAVIESDDYGNRPVSRSILTPGAFGQASVSKSISRANRGTEMYSRQERSPSRNMPETAGKFLSANQQQGRKLTDPKTVVNQPKLAKRSEFYNDDLLHRVDRRCFGLLSGDSEAVPAIKLVVKINALDDPGMTKTLQLDFVLEEFLVEYCNEIFQNVYNILTDYKSLFWLGSLYPAPKKRTLQRQIELYTPLYVLRNMIVPSSAQVISNDSIQDYFDKCKKEKKKRIPESELLKDQLKKEMDLLEAVRGADKALRELDFKIQFLLKRINFGVTGDKEDVLVGNQTLLEFGLEDQAIRLSKEGFQCKGSVFGFTFKTFNSFEMIVEFLQRLKKFSKMHSDSLAIQHSYEQYRKFIRNTKRRTEDRKAQEKKNKQEKDERRQGHPLINVVHAQNDESDGESFNPNQFQGDMEHKLRFNQRIMSPERNDAPLLGPSALNQQRSAFDRRE